MDKDRDIAMPPPQRVFSFAEIVNGRDSTVPITDDNLIHAVPFVMVMTGKDRNNAGRDLRDLKEEIFHSTIFVERQLSTHGWPKTKLVMAKETRTKCPKWQALRIPGQKKP
jgi:hypothetical protein